MVIDQILKIIDTGTENIKVDNYSLVVNTDYAEKLIDIEGLE